MGLFAFSKILWQIRKKNKKLRIYHKLIIFTSIAFLLLVDCAAGWQFVITFVHEFLLA